MDNSKGNLKLRVKVGDSVFIGDVEVIVSEVFGNSAKLHIRADRSTKILRGALLDDKSKDSEDMH